MRDRCAASATTSRGAPMAIVAGNSVGFLAVTLAAAQVGVRYTLVNRHLAPPEIDFDSEWSLPVVRRR